VDYSIIMCDTETCGLDPVKHDVIEVSFIKLKTNEQRTYFIKPLNINNIDQGALRINGHKLEDLLHQTKYGKDTYKDPNKVIVEIENWINEDDCMVSNRVLVGQNIMFDKMMLEQLWKKCNAFDSFPFGRRYLDTMQIQFFLDWCKNEMDESYSLSALIKRYGIKNDKAHTASADTKATKELFEKQVELFKKILNA
jgi:DNA polymerase III epsilon subunit-like protein